MADYWPIVIYIRIHNFCKSIAEWHGREEKERKKHIKND